MVSGISPGHCCYLIASAAEFEPQATPEIQEKAREDTVSWRSRQRLGTQSSSLTNARPPGAVRADHMTQRRKTVVVTGASQGIGAEIASLFLEHNYNVVANSRRISSAIGLRPREAFALVDGDIGLEATAQMIVATAVDRFGSVDALVTTQASSRPSRSPTTRRRKLMPSWQRTSTASFT